LLSHLSTSMCSQLAPRLEHWRPTSQQRDTGQSCLRLPVKGVRCELQQNVSSSLSFSWELSSKHVFSQSEQFSLSKPMNWCLEIDSNGFLMEEKGLFNERRCVWQTLGPLPNPTQS